METHNNDNENSWSTIGWQAALIVNRLRCQAQILELTSEEKKEEPRDENPKPGDKDERGDTEQEKYIVARIREITAWEKRQKGIKM
jgi:hypothetical protein